MARSSREVAERTGRRILEASTEAFASRGYARVKLEEVAAAAGVTRGAVYHRYASKEALFAGVLAKVMSAVAVEVEGIADGVPDDDPFVGLEAGCLAFVRAATSPGVRRILLVDGPAVVGWEAWRELDADHSRRTLEAGLEPIRSEGLLRGDPSAAAILLSGALNEAALWVAAAEDPEVAMQSVAETFPLLLNALRV
ncbi:TetR family transcriptional regulator [Ammonicoccus fulvus]|uniref:TetR family transcriptional regulator n=1 Tax=Ammonicoccus fulvus TaxID=3138240 RepID=A0ABZ3FKN6_9ACTN